MEIGARLRLDYIVPALIWCARMDIKHCYMA